MKVSKTKCNKLSFITLTVSGLLIICILAITAWVLVIPKFWQKEISIREIYIPTGTTFSQIVDILDENELIHDKNTFWLAAKILRVAGKLQAGKYAINTGLSHYSVLQILTQGKVTAEWVTIPEGTDRFEIASILSKKVNIDSAKFIQLTENINNIAKIDTNAPSLEGYLYPETYRLFWGIDEQKIIDIMLKQFNNHFNDSLKIRLTELGMSTHEILTIASIIEGEASVDSERVLISAIYHNRLRKNMLLQACPTVQYVLPGPPRRLLNKDLEIDSPFNTYIYAGLPPGPVNNPGIKSIKAALYPSDVDYLYLVAKGDGSHVFSRTMQAHIRAKREFNKLRNDLYNND